MYRSLTLLCIALGEVWLEVSIELSVAKSLQRDNPYTHSVRFALGASSSS